MSRFRNPRTSASSHVCHRIVLPRRNAASARRVATPPGLPPTVPAGGGPASSEREPAHTGREPVSTGLFAEARVEKELVERAVARIRAEAGVRRSPDGAHQRQIQILERRLEKLANLLELREGELERFKRQDLVEPGIASSFDTVQGLSPDSPMVEAKRALMKRIFEQNVALQEAIRGGRSA